MNDRWNEILDDYNKAKSALLCTEDVKLWRRDEDKGKYYLWNAYYNSIKEEPKEPLLYARILMMMVREAGIQLSNYDIFNKYIKPAFESYNVAKEKGELFLNNEYDRIKLLYESSKYELECEKQPYEEQLKHISGYDKLDAFDFHDSKAIYYEHSLENAKLKLKYDNEVVTLCFVEPIEIKIATEPIDDWILDFYCYPCYHDKSILKFDIGFYKIICKQIVVESIEGCD